MCIIGLAGVAMASGGRNEDVDSFARAHYDEYVIDTFAAEPTVSVWIDPIEMNLSQLDSLGLDTVRGMWMSSGQFSIQIPIRLIDSVRALATVKDVHYETWREYARGYFDLGPDDYWVIDTSGPEPIAGVEIVTNGDFSQLDSLGIVYSRFGQGGRVTARIPLRLRREIVHLPTVRTVSIQERTISIPEKPLILPAGWIEGSVRGSGRAVLRAELYETTSDTAASERLAASKCAGRADVDAHGGFNFVKVPQGTYAIALRVVAMRRSDSADASVALPDSGILCAVVEGVQIEDFKMSAIDVDVSNICGAAETSAVGVHRIKWVPQYRSH